MIFRHTRSGLNTTVHSKGTKPPTTSRRWNEKEAGKAGGERHRMDPVLFSEFAKYPFTKFHKKAIKRITTNMEWYEVLSWSRELAKSTIVFMCMMYLVLTGKKRNVLLISNSHENAVRLLEPYKKPLRAIPC